LVRNSGVNCGSIRLAKPGMIAYLEELGELTSEKSTLIVHSADIAIGSES
jgi:hypothetical protein